MWHGVAQAAAMAQVLRTCTMATIVEKTVVTTAYSLLIVVKDFEPCASLWWC